MQISDFLPASQGEISEFPSVLLKQLDLGQRVEALVLSPANVGELVKLRVLDTLLKIQTPYPLQRGQTVQLELIQQGDKPLLKLIDPLTATALIRQAKEVDTATALSLKPGQQLAVEVIKTVAPNRLLVELRTTQAGELHPSTQAPASVQVSLETTRTQTPLETTRAQTKLTAQPSSTLIPALPRQTVEVDVSALKQLFKTGDKLLMEVIKTAPLAVRLQAEPVVRSEVIQQQLRKLLPQLNVAQTAPVLKQLSELVQTHPQITTPVKQQINQLFQHINDWQELQKPDILEKTLKQSGVFLEQQLRNQPQTVNGDFKANLLRVVEGLRLTVQAISPQVSQQMMANINNLPVEIQAALARVSELPQDLNRLPDQIRTALASSERMPVQLLTTLLAALGHSSAADSATTKTLTAALTQAVKSAQITPPIQIEQKVQQGVELHMLRDLLRGVESVVSKVQINQLSMLKDPDTQNNMNIWLMDIPIKDKQQLNMMHLRFEQRKQGSSEQEGGEDEHSWQVQLNLETQNLGPMQASITLFGEKVNVIVKASREGSAILLEQYMLTLEQRLEQLGLTVTELQCHCAPVTEPTNHNKLKAATNLYGGSVDISV